jgi:hypothetical protein
MNRLAGFALWMGACFTAVGDSRADWQVWTVVQTRRVLRDEAAGPAGSSHSTRRDEAAGPVVEARLAVARNQW